MTNGFQTGSGGNIAELADPVGYAKMLESAEQTANMAARQYMQVWQQNMPSLEGRLGSGQISAQTRGDSKRVLNIDELFNSAALAYISALNGVSPEDANFWMQRLDQTASDKAMGYLESGNKGKAVKIFGYRAGEDMKEWLKLVEPGAIDMAYGALMSGNQKELPLLLYLFKQAYIADIMRKREFAAKTLLSSGAADSRFRADMANHIQQTSGTNLEATNAVRSQTPEVSAQELLTRAYARQDAAEKGYAPRTTSMASGN